MALTISQLFPPTVLGIVASIIYSMPTLPTTSTLKNGRIRVTNTTSTPATVILYAGPAGAASSSIIMFLSPVSIASNSSLEVDIPSMAAGDTLRGLAGTAASITVHEMGGVVFS